MQARSLLLSIHSLFIPSFLSVTYQVGAIPLASLIITRFELCCQKLTHSLFLHPLLYQVNNAIVKHQMLPSFTSNVALGSTWTAMNWNHYADPQSNQSNVSGGARGDGYIGRLLSSLLLLWLLLQFILFSLSLSYSPTHLYKRHCTVNKWKHRSFHFHVHSLTSLTHLPQQHTWPYHS
jgi:hypothetical protein